MHKSYFVEKELFEIPCQGESLIYAPLLKTVIWADKGLVNLLCDLQEGKPVDDAGNEKTISRLRRLKILRDSPSEEKSPAETERDYQQPFLPANLTLFLTSDCNLACRYCYGDGGDRQTTMPLEVGMEAIDLMFLNAAKSGARQVQLGFHGGGEPIVKRGRLVELVEHARKLSNRRRIGLQIGISTNGVMSRQSAEWVAANITQLNVSFDGPPEVQNRQRPFKNGAASYGRVKSTLRFWESRRKRYSIRGTITRCSQGRIPEIVGHLVEHFQPNSIHLEPMFFSRRADGHHLEPPEAQPFVHGFLQAARMLEPKGVPLHFSGSSFPETKRTFCGIGWKNFAVTPEGEVTSCFEVLSRGDGRADRFIYGHYVSGKGFQLDVEKIAALRRMSDEEPDYCRNCFAKFHCAGDCRAKGAALTDRNGHQGAGRCDIIRGIIKGKLLEQLSIGEEGEEIHGEQ